MRISLIMSLSLVFMRLSIIKHKSLSCIYETIFYVPETLMFMNSFRFMDFYDHGYSIKFIIFREALVSVIRTHFYSK